MRVFLEKKYFQRIRRDFIILFLCENPCKNKTAAFLRIQNVHWQLANRRTRRSAAPSILSTRVSLAQLAGPASPSAPVLAWRSSRVPRLPQHRVSLAQLAAPASASTHVCSFSSSKLLCIHDSVSSRLLQHLPLSIRYFDVRRGNRCVIKCKTSQHLLLPCCTLQ